MASPVPDFPVPDNEEARLASLHKYRILDTPADFEFDLLTEMARSICGTQISLVCLIDRHRQWFKAQAGFHSVRETPREYSLCAHAIMADELFVVEDTHNDPRFAHSPLVTGEPNIRFYAGAPLVVEDGLRLGTLCVIDAKPGQLSANKASVLCALRDEVVAKITQTRRANKQAISICAWCQNTPYKDTLARHPTLIDLPFTHGICAECAQTLLDS